ncbi:MAG: PA2778 family cysteine peptidase [Pseudomonadota bacterium]
MAYTCSARAIAGVLLIWLLSACSTPQTQALLSASPSHLRQRTELSQVPFFPQEAYQCGPAALATVLQQSGVAVQPAQLTGFLMIPEKKGSLQAEMLASARREGRVAYQLKPELTVVLSEIAAGNPVVVLQNLALSWYPMWHYAVMIGYDLPQREILLRSGVNPRQQLPLKTFEYTWARGNYWAMLVLPVGQLPRTADPESYMLALAALEHTSPQTDSWPGYLASIERWPDSLAVQIGAGNAAYRRHDLNLSERFFLQAQKDHPDVVAVLNNLAQVQNELGKKGLALATARHAVELGGPLQPEARKTLAEIEQNQPH